MKLVTMSGKNNMGHSFNLLNMAGTSDMMQLDPRDLNKTDAGIVALYWVSKMYPNITWGDIIEGQNTMGKKWWEKVGQAVGNAVSNAGDKLGEWGGQTTRLISNEKVKSTIAQYAKNVATGGKTNALKLLWDKLGDKITPKQKQEVLDSIGETIQIDSASMDNQSQPGQLVAGVPNMYLGAGAIGAVLLIALLK